MNVNVNPSILLLIMDKLKNALFLALVVSFVAMMVVDNLLRRQLYEKDNGFESSFFFRIERNKTMDRNERKRWGK